ncbi:tyrosine-protein phosphatase [Priestia aryabhattai]|uniref:tyrosine-protein phosphatase n=1 Tax=Priestia aryabhattai TaxID=412384 RepID=UPI0008DD2836|nr:CpsB/CapC family capsule biosynthesis tyrosine phosphatase [Priestia aryabhattai]MDH3134516.1 capsular biosynthesis protein [Priestia aryabhattai]OHY77547.1 capsular biosynthesis protein [Priestia aryabhattai]
MIDIHTYILPNIDSGPEEVDGFLKMARSLADQGVQSVVATPLYDSDQEFMKHHLFLYVNAANEWLTNSCIPLQVLPGQLIPLSPQLLRNYERNQLLTLNHTDKYLFLSLPEYDISPYFEKTLYDLLTKGVVPIIRSPECHPIFRDHPERLYELVKKGVLIQLSAASILGLNGKKERKAACTFIKYRLAHVIASGVHARNYHDYSLSKAYDYISDMYGASELYFFIENAEAIIDGRPVHQLEPEPMKKFSLFKLFS